MILKPRDAAGASGTHRADDADQLAAAIRATGVDRGAGIAVEEFIEGHEGFYDTISIDGQVVHEFVSHYYPNVLDAMRHRWISPQFIATNRVDEAGVYDEVKALGRTVNEALGIGTSATHMEWFFGPKGLKFSEIGCRPPGVRAWDLYAVGNDIDIYREWAMAVVHGRPSQQLSRRFAAGIIALRPDHDGVIAGYEGLDAVQQQFGEWIIDHHLPPDGTPTQPVEAGYMANAWIRLKHPDFDTCTGCSTRSARWSRSAPDDDASGRGDAARPAAADADAARRGSGGGYRPRLVVVRADGHHHRRMAGARGRRPRPASTPCSATPSTCACTHGLPTSSSATPSSPPPTASVAAGCATCRACTSCDSATPWTPCTSWRGAPTGGR